MIPILLVLRALAMPDWLDVEIVIVFAMAAGGIWVMWKEQREYRRDADDRVDLHSRLAIVETAIASENTSTLAERVATLESRPELVEDLALVRERLATIEARIDFKPITHTRGAKGKFVSPSAANTCEDPR